MRAGVFSGDALAPDAELVDRVRLGPVDARRGPLRRGHHAARRTSCPPTAEHRFPVAALDLGIKSNTPRMLAARGVETHVLPAHTADRADRGAGPGRVLPGQRPGRPGHRRRARSRSPARCCERRIPLFGICFGNQILGRALGFGTYKLRYGHRGINHPVLEHATGKVSITAQNHGFAVEGAAGERFDTPFGPVEVSHICLNDGVRRGPARCSTCRPSPCSTTRRRRPGRTTPPTCSTGSSS